jgi:imidazolonepropionase-like amidohydrolase
MQTAMIHRVSWSGLAAAALGLACGAGPSGTSGSGAAGRPEAPIAARPAIAIQPGDLVIANAAVVPMSRDGELARHTVVIRGDRIVAVAPSGELPVPAGATAIDGTGKWVMPGLTDMHVHVFGDDQLAMLVAAGVTTVRNMYGSEQHLAWRGRIARGELLGPTIVTAGPLIDGDPPIWPGSTVLVNPADADKVVTDQKAAGYDFLKPYSRLSKPAYEALAAAGKRHGMLLEGHVPDAVGLDGVLAAGQRTIEHLDGYLIAQVPDGVTLPDDRRAKLRATLAHLDRSRLAGAVARTVAAGTWNCPTLIVYERFGALDDLPALRRRVAWLDKLPSTVVDAWDPRQDFRLQSYTAEDFAVIRAANAERTRVLAALASAGAPILVGTDTGNPFVVPGAALHDEIELLIAAGLPRPRVLRAATADAARFLGAPREAGVVEAGARADLLLVASDPLTSPLPLVPDGVVLRGTWLPRAELEARLADIAKRVAAPPPHDRWEGIAPLAPRGTPVHQAHYDLVTAGKPVGEERLAIGMVGGKRVIVGQELAEFAGRFVTSYEVSPDSVALDATSPFGSVHLTGKLTGGKLVVTGTGQAGKPLAFSEPVPPGAFLTGLGLGDTFTLAEHLSGIQPGERRQLVALSLTSYPAPGIATIHYDVERKPDAADQRVFAVTITTGGFTNRGDVVLDRAGFVVSQQLGPPFNVTFTRRAK